MTAKRPEMAGEVCHVLVSGPLKVMAHWDTLSGSRAGDREDERRELSAGLGANTRA